LLRRSGGKASMVDFSKLTRPKASSSPINPIEIFKKTPNLGQAPNDLWKGQAEALQQWHDARKKDDNLIILNTGAGKSIVGILIAQSLVNEEAGPVVYVCSTIDLVNQTAKECDRIGIRYSTRAGQKFNNDLFETGKAFCITTYSAIFSPITAFRNLLSPAALVFDDAHVAERIVRDSFTLTVTKRDHKELYNDLLSIFASEFERINKKDHLSFIVEDVGQLNVTMCPPSTAHRNKAQIIDTLKKHKYNDSPELKFPTIQLYEHIGYCAVFISSAAIEFTPPFIPNRSFEFLRKGVRRVYLSATLDYDTDFVRAFGVSSPNKIEPSNDAGNGERLILLSSEFAEVEGKIDLAKRLSQKHKILISVPSYIKAKQWESVAIPPPSSEFTPALERFRRGEKGAFCLVSRVDGIDLPQDTCRIMVVDGAPSGASLLERYQFVSLRLDNLFSTKLAARVTQLLGRINRGRSDYGVFIVYSNDITNWLKNERNISLLPQLIRKQIMLGQSLQQDVGKSANTDVLSITDKVLSRDNGWIDFYRDTIDGLEVSTAAIERVKEREAALARSAQAESDYMTALWNSDIVQARKSLLDTLDATADADAKLAGWHSIWLGMTYEIEGDTASADFHYRRARARLSPKLNLPINHIHTHGDRSVDENGALHGKLMSVNLNGAQAIGNFLAFLNKQCQTLLDETVSFKQHEEALRSIGETLGYEASRPDNEHGAGPDVIWADSSKQYLVAFELKTKKEHPYEYNKSEIGQCLNHQEWIKSNYRDHKSDGLLIVGGEGACTANASPSDDLFLSDPKVITSKIRTFCSRVDDLRGRTDIERWTLLSELGQLSEWQLQGWFLAFKGKRLKDLQAR